MTSEGLVSKKVHPFFSGPPKQPPPSDSPSPTPAANDIRASTPKNQRNEDTILDEPSPKRRRGSNSGTRLGDEGVHNVASNSKDGLEAGTNPHPLGRTRESELNTDTSSTAKGNNDSAPSLKPKTLLKLDFKAGTIGPPPKPPPQTNQDNEKAPRSRGRPKGRKSRVVSVKYGTDPASRARIGSRISDVLALGGESSSGGCAKERKKRGPQTGRALSLRASPVKKGSTTAALSPTSPTTPATKATRQTAESTATESTKTTHPFFLSNPKDTSSSNIKQAPPKAEIPPTQAKPRPKEFSSTPRSPKKPRHAYSGRVPQFGGNCGGTRVPGASAPAWPWKDIGHIRGDSRAISAPCLDSDNFCYESSQLLARKSKSTATKVFETESVLLEFERRLGLPLVMEQIHNAASGDGFAPIPSELRLPVRHFESGAKLQNMILPQLRTLEVESPESEDELARSSSPSQRKTHPVLRHLYHQLLTNLPAFDRYDCETSAWAQKYAPQLAVDVLQAGKEALFLKDWLQKLKVHSVNTGSTDGEKSKRRGRPPKESSAEKKKRKRSKLDGFIVESEDEADDMDEVSDPEEEWAGTSHAQLKTVIRNRDQAAKQKDKVKLTNAVVISGPHGCGKTAAVYAVAKELGYEVREIYPGSRRSGKDVAEMIEAMTQNHIVRQSAQGVVVDGEQEQSDDEVSRDLKSGKQKTMASFFKPKAPSKAAKPTKALTAQKKPVKVEPKRPATEQRQSLILLEEVDILYEQDKQFWATVISLITQSKRPFIMTCNEEKLVPIHSLNLHGIFRFTPPPPALAVDHMLLVAANEGHVLGRGAVESLYQTRNNDLRACLSDLNFWCQIGVGDQRGGLSWYYPRWPKGVDHDEHGDVVRVVSEGTYHEGMGWLCRDSICGAGSSKALEVNLLTQTWDRYQLDMGQWQDTLDMEGWADEVAETERTKSLRLKMLEEYEDFSSQMSDADTVSRGAFALGNGLSIDAALPELTPAARDDFVIGRQLLEALPTHSYDGLCAHIATSIKSLAREDLARRSQPATPDSESAISAMDEANAISHIKTQHLPKIWDAAVNRLDMAMAFDPISCSEKQQLGLGPVGGGSSLDPSVFDRTMRLITLEVAPYVRQIVSYDMRLQEERLRRSNLLSEGGSGGGRHGKRMRTTRSAYSAMEGGSRRTTRRDKYFGNELNTALVLRTGGEGWNECVEMVSSSASPEAEDVDADVDMEASRTGGDRCPTNK